MLRPDNKQVTASGFKGTGIIKHSLTQVWITWSPNMIDDIVGGNKRKRIWRLAIFISPHATMSNVNNAMRVKGYVDIFKLRSDTINHFGQSFHVRHRTLYRQSCRKRCTICELNRMWRTVVIAHEAILWVNNN